jgi:sensor histidine kinase YesM
MDLHYVSEWINLNSMIGILLVVPISIVGWRKGVEDSKYLFFAWFCLIVGMTVFILKDFNVLPYNEFTIYSMPVGSALEMTLISFALTKRIRVLRREKAVIRKTHVINLIEGGHMKIAIKNLKKQLREARFKALLNQLNPHFLFNILNSVSGFIQMDDKREASRILGRFSRVMRTTLENNRNNFLTVQREVSNLDDLMDLELEKLSDDFRFYVDMDPQIKQDECVIPSGIIQPLVENAIVHGFEGEDVDGGKITVSIHLIPRIRDINFNGRLIRIKVWDNGIGLEKAKEREPKGNHISAGTQLVLEKLTLSFGRLSHSFERRMNDDGIGTLVVVIIPYLTTDLYAKDEGNDDQINEQIANGYFKRSPVDLDDIPFYVEESEKIDEEEEDSDENLDDPK